MKKKIYLKMALGITLLVMIGTNICNSFKKETLSDLVLSNVEALANSRENVYRRLSAVIVKMVGTCSEIKSCH
mgnify:CR=1 FL=1